MAECSAPTQIKHVALSHISIPLSSFSSHYPSRYTIHRHKTLFCCIVIVHRKNEKSYHSHALDSTAFMSRPHGINIQQNPNMGLQSSIDLWFQVIAWMVKPCSGPHVISIEYEIMNIVYRPKRTSLFIYVTLNDKTCEECTFTAGINKLVYPRTNVRIGLCQCLGTIRISRPHWLGSHNEHWVNQFCLSEELISIYSMFFLHTSYIQQCIYSSLTT